MMCSGTVIESVSGGCVICAGSIIKRWRAEILEVVLQN